MAETDATDRRHSDIPVFHDGYLTGVRLGEASATLAIRDVRGDAYELDLNGLEALQIDGFREGNIILWLRVITGERPQ